MVKKDMIEAIATRTGMSEYDAKVMLEAYLAISTEVLNRGEEIQFRGFGTWQVKTRAPKSVRNINTGEQYVMGCKRRVVFTPGIDLKQG